MPRTIPSFGTGEKIYRIGIGPLAGFHVNIRANSTQEAFDYVISQQFSSDLLEWDTRMAHRLFLENWKFIE